MRLLTVAFAALLLLPCARAADLSGVLADYLLGKVPPTQENTRSKGMQVRLWNKPTGLDADKLLFVFAYGVSTDHWTLVLVDPRATGKDYLGAGHLTRLGRVTTPVVTDIYRADDGRFQGYFLEDAVDHGHHLLEIYTPKMAAMTPELAGYVK